MFKDYCENITEKEYRESPRLSYSFIKELADIGPSIIRDGIKKKSGDGLTLGYIVDKKLSEPDWDILSEFTLTDIKIDWTKDDHKTNILKLYKDDPSKVLLSTDELYELLGIKRAPAWDEEFIEKISIVTNSDKYLHQSEYELALRMIDSLLYHKHTTGFFHVGFNCEVIDQAIILFKLNGVDIRSMLDKVIIDHEAKTIQPLDIKTGTEFNFMTNFYKFKYYYQAALYIAAIESIVQFKEEFKGYKVLPFKFIYVSRQKPELPLVYQMPEKYIEKVMIGFESNGYHTKGILELVDDYKWYIDNNEFELRRDIMENNGVIQINNPS